MNDQLLCFNGERADPVSMVLHLGNGYRAYHPLLKRFTSPDSQCPFGEGGINTYAFCAGEPVNQSDPSGHMSVGQWIGISIGLVGGIVLSVMTEGASLPAVVSLLTTIAGEAAIGAGAEIATETISGQRLSWGQVGIAMGISAASALAGYGMGRFAKLQKLPCRSFGALMMAEGEGADEIGGQFRHPQLIGIFREETRRTSSMALSFIDRFQGADRLNIVGPVGSDAGMVSGTWNGERFVTTHINSAEVAELIESQLTINPGIRNVRLAVPFAGQRIGNEESLHANVTYFLRLRGRNLNVSAPQRGYTLRGPVPQTITRLLSRLESAGIMENPGANGASPQEFHHLLNRLTEHYSDTADAFHIEGF